MKEGKYDAPTSQDLVLIGGGHSHVIALSILAKRDLPGVRITLISNAAMTPYSGMLPGLIAGNYDYDEVHIDLSTLCKNLGVRFIENRVTGLDLDTKRIICEKNDFVSYDVLSIDIGSSPDLKRIPGAKEHTVGVKPVDRFLDYWQKLQEEILQSAPDEVFNIGIVGGGASSVEVALAMQYKLDILFKNVNRNNDRVHFHVVSGGNTILASHNAKVQRLYQKVLDDRNVKVYNNFRVTEVNDIGVWSESGQCLKFDSVIWAISASAPDWPKASGLACSELGFIQVDVCLQSVSHPGVFASGDIADVIEHPRPKAGVFAVRQGKPLALNLEKALLGQPLKPFTAQKKFLSLVSTGDKNAIASRGNWALSGSLIWRWKDSIDRKFMRRF